MPVAKSDMASSKERRLSYKLGLEVVGGANPHRAMITTSGSSLISGLNLEVPRPCATVNGGGLVLGAKEEAFAFFLVSPSQDPVNLFRRAFLIGLVLALIVAKSTRVKRQ